MMIRKVAGWILIASACVGPIPFALSGFGMVKLEYPDGLRTATPAEAIGGILGSLAIFGIPGWWLVRRSTMLPMWFRVLRVLYHNSVLRTCPLCGGRIKLSSPRRTMSDNVDLLWWYCVSCQNSWRKCPKCDQVAIDYRACRKCGHLERD